MILYFTLRLGPLHAHSYLHTHTHTHSLSFSYTHTHTHTHTLTHILYYPKHIFKMLRPGGSWINFGETCRHSLITCNLFSHTPPFLLFYFSPLKFFHATCIHTQNKHISVNILIFTLFMFSTKALFSITLTIIERLLLLSCPTMKCDMSYAPWALRSLCVRVYIYIL